MQSNINHLEQKNHQQPSVRSVFTVFCFGTDESYAKTENIISCFANACTDDDRPPSCDELAKAEQTGHNSDTAYIDGPQTRLGDIRGREQVNANLEKITRSLIGWYRNSNSAQGGITINMKGFSRGAVTCIREQFRLQRRIDEHGNILDPRGEIIRNKKSVPLNIRDIEFGAIDAQDPVAGASDKGDPDAREIRSNVRHLLVTYQLDEMRQEFRPQDKTRIYADDLERTSIGYALNYGNHSDGIKIKSKEMAAVAEITWNRTYRFMSSHGTRFKKMPKMVEATPNGYVQRDWQPASDIQLLNQYAELKKHRQAYKTSGQKIKMDSVLVREERSMNRQLNDYVAEPAIFDSDGVLQGGFFTDQWERELFKTTYPKTFNYLFEAGLQRNYTDAQLRAELETLYQQNRGLFEFLHHRGVERIESNDMVGSSYIQIPDHPRGIPRIENCHFTAMLENRNIVLSKEELLEKEINQVVERYLREKPEYLIISERSQAEHAKKIKEEVRRIMNSNSNNKYNDMLNCIESQALLLRQIGAGSELTVQLERVLEKNGRKYREEPSSLAAPVGVIFGFGIQKLGEGVRALGRGISYVVGGLVGKYLLEDVGRGIGRIGKTRTSTLGKTFGLIPRFLGGLMQLAGKGLQLISKAVEKVGDFIKGSGNQIVRVTGVYRGQFERHPVTPPVQQTPSVSARASVRPDGAPEMEVKQPQPSSRVHNSTTAITHLENAGHEREVLNKEIVDLHKQIEHDQKTPHVNTPSRTTAPVSQATATTARCADCQQEDCQCEHPRSPSA